MRAAYISACGGRYPLRTPSLATPTQAFRPSLVVRRWPRVLVNMPRRMSLISATLSCLANIVTGYPSKCFQARVTAIPDYALTYAPYTVLYSKEHYFPSDVVTHLEHTTPEVCAASNQSAKLTLPIAGQLYRHRGRNHPSRP